MTGSVSHRTPYQGLVQIFQYNRPFYAWTVAGIAGAVILSMSVSVPLRTLLLFAAGIAVFWTSSSLLVSYYVYDRSDLYRLSWLPECLSQAPSRWINIHAGLDEVSVAIASIFPGSEMQIADIYDPREMTEPSIKRARRISAASSERADCRVLLALDQQFDTAFLIFSAHELRRHEARVQLLRDVARVLRASGELVVVEPLRDWANFVAFGPGFLHFFSARAWQSDAKAAALDLRLRRRVTPFVHVFVFQRR